MCDLVQPRVLELYPAVTFEFGDVSRATHGKPPRVVWCRMDAQVVPTQTTAKNPRAVAQRNAGVVAVCWATKGGAFDTDDAAIESLVDAVEIALREKLGPSAALPFAENWTAESIAALGKTAAIEFAVRMPICLPDPTEVATDSDPIEVGFDNDASSDTDKNLDAGES